MTENLSNDMLERFKRVEENYFLILDTIKRAALQTGRKENEIIFLAATKTVPPEVINHAFGLGLRYLGENRVQELLAKYDELHLTDRHMQFIGHLQTNKVHQIINKVEMIQSVDRLKLAQEISRLAINTHKRMDVLVEVNIGYEENKSGVEPYKLEEFLYSLSTLQGIRVRGLMAIPPICENKSQIRRYFSDMHELFVDIGTKKIDNICMEYLSMGMSGDYEQAILEGANMVRVGSALFGARNY
jgi:pyridoxal phosphate enzyme (YggS family)